MPMCWKPACATAKASSTTASSSRKSAGEFAEPLPKLLDRDPCPLDHVRPPGDLGLEERLDVRERHVHGFARRRGDLCLHARIGERLLNLGVELVDDRLRCAFR